MAVIVLASSVGLTACSSGSSDASSTATATATSSEEDPQLEDDQASQIAGQVGCENVQAQADSSTAFPAAQSIVTCEIDNYPLTIVAFATSGQASEGIAYLRQETPSGETREAIEGDTYIAYMNNNNTVPQQVATAFEGIGAQVVPVTSA